MNTHSHYMQEHTSHVVTVTFMQAIGDMRMIVKVRNMVRVMMSFEMVISPELVIWCYRRVQVLRVHEGGRNW